MLNVLLWLAAVEIVGLAAFPIAYYLLPHLRDRGYSLSKPLGILILAYASWILSVLHILPSQQLTVLLLLIAIGAASAWYARGRRDELLAFWRRERTAIIAAEVVFLAMFFGWVAYRAYDPAINHTEQPMDFAFLNASIRSTVGSPEDPWLSGESVSYYYFGYWMMGALSKLTGISSSVSYNLALAVIPAMAAMGVFGLVYSMVRAEATRLPYRPSLIVLMGPAGVLLLVYERLRGEARRLRWALVGGVAAAVLLVASANMQGPLEFARANGIGSEGFWGRVGIQGMEEPPASLSTSWTPEEFWWWWRASRVISTVQGDQVLDYTIEEFPFFSFMLGDLHPHVMSIPFVLLFLGFCWSFFRAPADGLMRLGVRPVLTILAMGLSLGGLAFTNMWDLPVFAAVLLGVAVLKAYSVRDGGVVRLLRLALPVWIAVVGVAVVLILPYLLTFTSQVQGVAPVLTPTTRPLHLVIVWGLFLVAVTPFILAEFWQTTVDEEWPRLLGALDARGLRALRHLGVPAGRPGGTVHKRFRKAVSGGAVRAVGQCGGVTARSGCPGRDRGSGGRVFALGLSALGLLLIMGPELLFVNDSFGGASERMNTVFKLYYQAWVVLAAASGFAIYYWSDLREQLRGTKRLLAGLWSAVFVVLLASSAYYPAAAAASKGDLFHDGATLDGLAHVGRGEYERSSISERRPTGLCPARGRWRRLQRFRGGCPEAPVSRRYWLAGARAPVARPPASPSRAGGKTWRAYTRPQTSRRRKPSWPGTA